MENKLQIFTNKDFGEIRAVIIEGEIWFVATDVAQILAIQNVRQDLAEFPDDEKSAVSIPYASSNGTVQQREVNIINESGLYRLIFKSRKPEAKRFQYWVFHEILPSIRKTGEYKANQEIVREPLTFSSILRDVDETKALIRSVFGGVKDGIATAKALNMVGKFYRQDLSELKELLPPAEHETGYMNATQLAEKVGRTARQANKWLADNGYQFRDGRDWRLTEKGKQYAEELPYSNRGHSGYQIKWASQIVTFLLEDSVQ